MFGVWDWGLGFGVCGLGFGVRGSWFRVWGLEFRVWSLGFGVSVTTQNIAGNDPKPDY